MDDKEWLARRFEEDRPRLRAVAYRMLGSLAEADDAVQDTWERVNRAGADEVENMSGWLTTILARVCLNTLRSRNTRPEDSVGVLMPDPVVAIDGQHLPEDEALLADSVGLALQIVLDTLSPAQRLAFVLHDLFDLPFEQIGPMLGRTVQATRQLASRARRQVRGAGIPATEQDRARQRAVVDAFFAAVRDGDFATLIAVLDPDVVLRADFSPGQPRRSTMIRGASTVARSARFGATTGAPTAKLLPALVNGAPGAILTRSGRPFAVMAFTVQHGKITEISMIGDAQRAQRLTAAILPDSGPAPDEPAQLVKR
jgi:RNA polymerase sigma factor (sigma-70 family)